jgi:hypothetical protein
MQNNKHVLFVGISSMVIMLMCFNTFAISVGEEGRLYSGGELVPVAISKEAFDEWTKARVAKDKDGQVLLLASGKILTPQKGTKVLVIDTGMFMRKVRILEGEYKGRSGWVATEYIK